MKPPARDPMTHFILPQQPDPSDTRERTAFGYLAGFGPACTAYWEARDRAEAAARKKPSENPS